MISTRPITLWRRTAVVLGAALMATIVACGEFVADPPFPAAVTVVSGDAQQGVVGAPLAEPLVVKVEDSLGEPAADAAVQWEVTAGGGEVSEATVATGVDGEVALLWTLGPTVGENTVRASVDGVGSVEFTAEAVVGPPSALSVAAGDAQTAEVGTPVAIAPAVRITDGFGNPIAGMAAACTVTGGGGSVAGGDVVTDASGVAAVDEWRLGTAPGENALQCGSEGLEPVVVTARAVAGPAASVTIQAGNGQTADAGMTVPVRPAVRVRDGYGNGVPGVTVTFAVASGGGTVTGGVAQTDSIGVGTVGAWTLGSEPGTNTLTATVADVGAVTFTAEARAVTLNLWVESIHLNQATQALDASIAGIADRPGLLRVMLRANEANTARPDIRVRVLHDGVVHREAVVSASGSGVPISPDLWVPAHTWDLRLEAEDVQPGLSVEVVVDPERAIAESDRSDNRYPATGSTPIAVEAHPPLAVVFFPIIATVHGTTGRITTENADTFLTATRMWMPVSGFETTVRPALTTDHDLRTESGWSALLSDLRAIRVAEGATYAFYHGVVGNFQGIALGGVAGGSRTSLSYDYGYMMAEGDIYGVVAHELGHNMGRGHAPCGDVGYADPDYPYPEAQIGPPGYDVVEDRVVTESFYRDFMSYCTVAQWTSDYTYRGLLEWRRGDPYAPAAGAAASRAGPVPGLLVWGRVTPDGITLNPAFTLEARPALPERDGPNTLRGLAADGRELFRVGFRGDAIADGADPEDRIFAFFLPLDTADLEAVSTIELGTPYGTVRRDRTPPVQAMGADGFSLEAVSRTRARLEWSPARYPRVLVRDRVTGRVLGIGSSGELTVDLDGLGLDRLEVLASDGVVTRRPQP